MLYIIDSTSYEIILGLPWFIIHDPSIFCTQHERWSTLCCFTTRIDSPGTTVKTKIPAIYQDLNKVFSKIKAAQLPHHGPWDCTIDVLLNVMPLKSKFYPL